MLKKEVLIYSFEKLEPFISEKVAKDHLKHYAYYQQELEKSLKNIKLPDKIKTIEDLVKNYLKLPKELHIPVRQFAGGVINHNFFFKIIKKGEILKDSELKKQIEKNFGSIEEFKNKFTEKALSIFGSGWTWLVIDKFDHLRIYNTYNQDNPWFLEMKPLICIDVWEHAYITDYDDDRAKYIKNFLNSINWSEVEKIYFEIKKQD